ncbi:putative telomere and ribosome associated protein Stm1 [Aspergillus ellipticus CBS 707.79]|uniref:Putative telomere and ribosome associated protein Stm1 n=1 Tax=Aspergillus ellipticus CBS 707.79 TaxID=1448320 RepID=A0A319D7L6_9EURO|nr:putative telomere and ribosome associated protein Stm1 [Aspergillus ellipticus CBS 707.79]
MADVRSKNLYELLGNDPELDPNRAPEPPTRAVDRPAPRAGKRDAPKEVVSQPRENTNSRRGGRATGNEAAFRDRNAGRSNNREKPTDDANNGQRRPRREGGERRHDRQSRTGQTDTRKQVNQGWGNQSGEKTLDDEKAGETIAQGDETEPQTPAEEKPEEPKGKSYDEFLAERAAQGDLSAKPVRSANEGSKLDKKWAAATELKRTEEDSYFKGKDDKAKREKQRKEKAYVDVDMRFVEAPRTGGAPGPRGGRGGRGARGGRGGRGGRGDGPAPRAAPAAASGSVTVDEKNFPSLGGK